jgi:hypothetical protein
MLIATKPDSSVACPPIKKMHDRPRLTLTRGACMFGSERSTWPVSESLIEFCWSPNDSDKYIFQIQVAIQCLLILRQLEKL